MRVLITGGAGFIGSNLAVALAERHPGWEVVAADNLYRRGSELNLPRLARAGASFEYADVRSWPDLDRLGVFDAVVESAAEPSVQAGRQGDRRVVIDTNLIGACHCLELAVRQDCPLILLSTSRVYPISALEQIAYSEDETRFVLEKEQSTPGASERGVSEHFPLGGARTLYGATKMAAETLALEYADTFGVRVTTNRCGVVSGPWQMARSDQGVFAHWVLSFYGRRPLSYVGYGGTGKQVRDVLHVDDLVDLIELQLASPENWAGVTVNVGGGAERSLSLREATALCRELTGNDLEVGSIAEGRPGDVPIYVSDCSRLFELTDWRPRRSSAEVLSDIFDWIRANERLFETI